MQWMQHQKLAASEKHMGFAKGMQWMQWMQLIFSFV